MCVWVRINIMSEYEETYRLKFYLVILKRFAMTGLVSE
jgi:hypothetical protein